MTEKDQNLSNRWLSRLNSANEIFDKWERKFRCKTLVDYYEGFQWGTAHRDFEPYVLNLVYSTIKIKRPTLLFRRPQFKIEPEPGRADFSPESAWQICQLQTDTLNTIVSKSHLNFAKHIEMAILDAWFYFGLIEVGFASNYLENPNVSKPALREDYDATGESTGKIIGERPAALSTERIFVKRVPASHFRVGGELSWELNKCSWCGYYEYYRISDILAAGSGFKNTENLKVSAPTSDDTVYDDTTEKKGNLVKVWKIWDMRRKMMYMLSEIGPTIIYERPFDRLPLFDLRFDKRTKGWYPIPPVFHWKPAQDEQNEAKEQLRAMRRRAKRVWQVVENMIEEEELAKLVAGPDGTVIYVKQPDAVRPVQTQAIDGSITSALVFSKDDFNILSGSSSEARGVADRQTATQANIIENRSVIREADERQVVAEWLCDIGREIILQVRENFTEDMWIKENTDIGAFGQDYDDIQQKFRLISPVTDLGDFDIFTGKYKDDFNVTIYVESLSPLTNDQEKAKFMEFMAIMHQYPQLALNPILIREAAYRIGYRNDQVIKGFQQAAILQMVGQVSTGEQAPESNISQLTSEQMQPPTMGQLEIQLSKLGVPNQ